MNTFQLQCFLTVADTLNFARAADRLSITQPAVTHQIRSLEGELNVKLFRRSTRNVELTQAGIIFMDDARKMMEISNRAKRRFENPAQQEVQPFSVGFQSYTQMMVFPNLWRGMREKYPNMHPRLRIAPAQHLYHLLEDETVDAFVSFREPELQKKSIQYREIARSSVTCICSVDSAAAQGGAGQLAEEKFVMSSPMQTPATLTQIQREMIGGRSPAELYFCELPEEILTLVRSGFGVSAFPSLILPEDPEIVQIPMPELPEMSFGVYYKSAQGNEPLRDFIRLMREAMEQPRHGKNIKKPETLL